MTLCESALEGLRRTSGINPFGRWSLRGRSFSQLLTASSSGIKATFVVFLLVAQLALGLHWAEHYAQAPESANDCAACHIVGSSSPDVTPIVVPIPLGYVVAQLRDASPAPHGSEFSAHFQSRAPPATSL